MLLTMKTKTDQSGGKSELGTSRDRWKGLTDCTASCKSQDTPCWKKGKIQHPLEVYRGAVFNVFVLSLRAPQPTAVLCLALSGFPLQSPPENKLQGEFMALAVPSHLQGVKPCPVTANGTGRSERDTKDHSFTL